MNAVHSDLQIMQENILRTKHIPSGVNAHIQLDI